ncbi:DUF3291 domain-containing protein [Nocardia sp. BMG111209]|uniref:DUF3291 domain-containing protein n=1 Tax=Nocardia sp. BMG111209 TaxID=1160137 RepID=UPI00036FD57A|nr:DUF3291 domain-containing protein [Nocardia sp. BMG111209]
MTATRGHHLAFTTFFVLRKPYGHPVVRGFEAAEPAIFDQADEFDGFIGRARYADSEQLPQSEITNFDRDWGSWGEFAVPAFHREPVAPGIDRRASTLSIWRDVDAVRDYVYSGRHLDALKRRDEWTDPESGTPNHAAWWIPAGHIPRWSDAVARLERLHTHGPTVDAFTLRSPFLPDGSGARR